jgi:hypothetical protein
MMILEHTQALQFCQHLLSHLSQLSRTPLPCHFMSCHVLSCHVMLYHVIPFHCIEESSQ